MTATADRATQWGVEMFATLRPQIERIDAMLAAARMPHGATSVACIAVGVSVLQRDGMDRAAVLEAVGALYDASAAAVALMNEADR